MSFKRLDPEDFVVSADSVQGIAWSTGAPTLTEFFTSPQQLASSNAPYYVSVYQTASTDTSATVQFDVAYADKLGSGSRPFSNFYPSRTPSSVIYGQYRSMILEDENAVFVTGQGSTGVVNPCTTNLSSTVVEMENFWVISPSRSRYRQTMFPGTFNLHLSSSNKILKLTDNSGDVSVQSFLGSSRVFQIVSGSNGQGITGGGYTPNSGSFGLFFPDTATILLNCEEISEEIGLTATRAASVTPTQNSTDLISSLQDAGHFQLNFEETITSDFVFIRARNAEFNYSENPSFISGSSGEVIFDNFINNPQVYATTVGMYNDANELVAVAKLSRPLLKDFTKENLIRVKLDF